MFRLYTIGMALLVSSSLFAQEYQEISTGPGYGKHSFVSLSNGDQKQINHSDWDICFTVQGQTSAGIFINEGSATNPPLAAMELHDAGTSDFGALIDPADLSEETRLYNDEQSWSFGAFNTGANLQSFNYGWGAYNPQTHVVEGNKVFVIKKRDGEYIKMIVNNFTAGAYNITYANLDGSDVRTASVAKADFGTHDMAYFSFQTGEAVALEPDGGYELIYTRYFYPVLDTANNVTLQYAVTGVLAAPGTQVVKVDGQNPANVNFEDHRSGLVQRPDAIGYEWKAFTGQGWSIDEDLTFFVVSRDQTVYKVVFIDFEGAGTGTAVLEKYNLGMLSVVSKPEFVSTFNIYPTLASQEINMVYTALANVNGESIVTLTNLKGERVMSQKVQSVVGLNAVRMDVGVLTAGTYIVSLQHGTQVISDKIIVVQ